MGCLFTKTCKNCDYCDNNNQDYDYNEKLKFFLEKNTNDKLFGYIILSKIKNNINNIYNLPFILKHINKNNALLIYSYFDELNVADNTNLLIMAFCLFLLKINHWKMITFLNLLYDNKIMESCIILAHCYHLGLGVRKNNDLMKNYYNEYIKYFTNHNSNQNNKILFF